MKCPTHGQKSSSQMTAIIIAKDYWGTLQAEATAGRVAAFMKDRVGVTSIETLAGARVTVPAVRAAIEGCVQGLSAGSRLYIFMLGHGNQITDLDGDESDGRDEAYQLPDGYVTDDWITDALVGAPASASVILVSDHCSSGSMIDAKRAARNGTQVGWFALGGCQDHEDAMMSSEGNVMLTHLLALLASLSDADLRALTLGDLARNLDASMKGSWVGTLQNISWHASCPHILDTPAFPSPASAN